MSVTPCRHQFTFPLPGWAFCARCDLHVTLRYDGIRPEWQQPAPPAPPVAPWGRHAGTTRLKTAHGLSLRFSVHGQSAEACVQQLQTLIAALTVGAQ